MRLDWSHAALVLAAVLLAPPYVYVIVKFAAAGWTAGIQYGRGLKRYIRSTRRKDCNG